MTCSNNKQPEADGLRRPLVGDTVVISGVVESVGPDCFTIQNGFNPFFISYAREYAIIPAPWEPQIGEEVDLRGRISVRDRGFTLLNVHGDGGSFHDGSIRKWATVAFLNDKPEVVLYSHILQRGIQ